MSAPRPRVSDERLAAFCEPVGFGVSRGEWVTDLALDLRDARARLAAVEKVVSAAEALARETVTLSIDARTRKPVGYFCAMCPAERVGDRKRMVHTPECKVPAVVAALDALRAGEKEGA